jgi:hypothetical protein
MNFPYYVWKGYVHNEEDEIIGEYLYVDTTYRHGLDEIVSGPFDKDVEAWNELDSLSNNFGIQ